MLHEFFDDSTRTQLLSLKVSPVYIDHAVRNIGDCPYIFTCNDLVSWHNVPKNFIQRLLVSHSYL